jgi:glycosyltransferase involved in cell wall biosynthesis
MNVLLLDQYSDLGGAQQVLLELLPAIRERGWKAVVGLPGNGKLFDAVRLVGIEPERIASGVTETPRLAAQIRDLVRRTAADILYLNGPRLLPAAALASVRCPVLFHSHSPVIGSLRRAAAGVSLRRMDAQIVANCEFVAAQWRPFVAADRIEVILNGVAGPSSMRPPRMDGAPLVGCIGRILYEKGQREFVAAAAQIHQSLPDCRFAIFGEPMFGEREAERYAEEVRTAAAGLPIEFRGWAPDVDAVLAELDLLLVPSIGPEATTRVILEAFAAGVPVIAFDTGGISEVMETGLLVPSADEMARAAIDLLGDPRRRADMARAGRAAWQERFTLAKFHDRLLRSIARLQRQPLLAVVTNDTA